MTSPRRHHIIWRLTVERRRRSDIYGASCCPQNYLALTDNALRCGWRCLHHLALTGSSPLCMRSLAEYYTCHTTQSTITIGVVALGTTPTPIAICTSWLSFHHRQYLPVLTRLKSIHYDIHLRPEDTTKVSPRWRYPIPRLAVSMRRRHPVYQRPTASPSSANLYGRRTSTLSHKQVLGCSTPEAAGVVQEGIATATVT
ncbi:unnamed protein product [Cyclocybe aegerita]|uniref:Uncharacterized protein n=1 Tax=Cyclocybe aegerita TaxID=1973307 RepID=A0A8S0WGT3_CYCAE|nr:unnamed protein product [Cyclocybe aegerita]